MTCFGTMLQLLNHTVCNLNIIYLYTSMLNMKNCVKRPIYYRHPRHFRQDIFGDDQTRKLKCKAVIADTNSLKGKFYLK